MRSIHYAGSARWRSGPKQRTVTTVSGGFALCCSGQRARDIAERGDHSHDRTEVTCKLCLAFLVKADAYGVLP